MTRPYIPHNGGRCPVKPDTLVDLQFRDGSEWKRARAGNWASWAKGVPDAWTGTSISASRHIIGWRLSFPQRRTIWQRIASIFKRKDTQ